jgi:tetratricopeptide (TPR) repeat protein
VKLQLGDPSCIETFEQAIDLDPSNGMAYISIGVTYYRISNRGDPRFETALNAFADAVTIDPAAYGPLVLSRMRSIGYTWKEDWEDIKQRVARRGTGFGAKTGGGPVKGPGEPTIGFQVPKPVPEPTQTYRNEEQGFKIDIPEKWRRSRISSSGPGDLVQYGCYEEAFNFLAAPLSPEPPLDQTERDFVQHAMLMGFSELEFGRITVGGKEHVCVKYRILDGTSERWNKKYMIVLDEIEYTITGTSDIKDWFVKREKDWDAFVRTFHPLGKSD